MMSDKQKKKPIMRALGESVGILWKSIKQPAHQADKPRRQVVDRKVKETRQGNITLRETTIREIEFNNQQNTDQNHPDPESTSATEEHDARDTNRS